MKVSTIAYGVTLAMACVVMIALPAAVWAVPYASGIQLSGVSSTFVLNEDGAQVSVVYDGGAMSVDLGTLGKGTHTFDETLGATWEIICRKQAPAGWTQFSSDSLSQSKYYSPKGVTVNRNVASPNFGRIYVSEGLGGAVGAGGRTTTDGLYVMGADQSDVLAQGDTAFGGGVDWTTSSSSPFKVAVAPDDTIYIADWSDSHSGVWRSNADPQPAFDEILDNTGRESSGLVPGLHGSVSSLFVEGTAADTKLYTLDEDLDLGGTPGSVLRYDIGTATSYATPPVEQTQDGTDIILNLLADVVRDEDGSWWIAQYRVEESPHAPSLTRFLDGAAAPVYNSAEDANLPRLTATYGNLDILNEQDLLVLGARSDSGVYVLDISDPANPTLLDTIPQNGYTRDVAFDVAGNVYVVSSSSETLRIWSPGGATVATTGSDGSFRVTVPEPTTLVLSALGCLALLCYRRRTLCG